MSYKEIDGVGYWCMNDEEKKNVEIIVKGINQLGWEIDDLREMNEKLQKQAYDVILQNEALKTRNKIITITAGVEGLAILILLAMGAAQ